MNRSATLLAMVLLLDACAYGSAMRKGRRAVQNGDFAAAYEHYTRAFGENPTPEASMERDVTRVKAVDQGEKLIEDALTSSDVPLAGEGWRVVQLAATEDEKQLSRERIQDSLLGRIDAQLKSGETDSAYRMALDAQEFFPEETFSELAIDKVRFHFRRAAEQLELEGRFREADEALAEIVKNEPARENTIALQRSEMRKKWADKLALDAKEHELAGRVGAAAVAYARVHELDVQRGIAGKARELAAQSAMGSAVRVYPNHGNSGTRSRRSSFEDSFAAAIEGLENGIVVDEDEANLVLTTDLGAAGCDDTKTAEAKSVDYVSGQIEVPNEPYVELEGQLQAAIAERDAAQARVDTLEAPYKKGQAAITKLEEAMSRAEEERDDASKRLARARETLAKQQERVASLEADLQTADPSETSTLNTKITMLRSNALEWDQEVTRWNEVADAANTALADARAELLDTRSAFDQTKFDYGAAVKALDKAEEQAREINGRASELSSTRNQDVVQTFEYDILSWTRTCNASLTVSSEPSWQTSQETRFSKTTETVLEDTSHPGHRGAKVEENPKEFAQTVSEVIADADSQNAAAMVEWLGSMAGELAQQQVVDARAAMVGDPAEGTEKVVSLYVGWPSVLDEATVEAFEAFLLEHHGLEDAKTLRETEAEASKAPDLDFLD